jgi:mRNA interferase MazF
VVRSDLFDDLNYATVLPITTDLRPGFSMRVDLQPDSENGLRSVSQVMVDWPQTLRYSDMGAAIGHLDAETMRAVTREMAVVLGIAGGTRRPRQF